jgi:hypothetical protein
MGLLNFDMTEAPINKLNNNKYNSIELEGGHIVKRGLTKFLQGEIYFYKNIPKSLSLSSYFPTFYGSLDCGDRSEIRTEYIRGVPLYTLYRSELLTETHIMRLFDILDCLHASVGSDIPQESEVRANYIDKCKMRFRDKTVYPFETASKYQDICLKQLETYLLKSPKIVSIIHGDFWLSNILLDFKNNIKLIDMKGRLESRLTLGGDVMYDYGKLYQSVLGYDLVLNNHTVKPDYSRTIQKIFIREFLKRGYAVEDLWSVTISLMMGSFHSIDLLSTRTTIWNWLTTLIDSHQR